MWTEALPSGHIGVVTGYRLVTWGKELLEWGRVGLILS